MKKKEENLIKKMKKIEDEIKNDEYRIILNEDEDFKEIEGIKFIPFSIDKELKEGKFEKGIYIEKEYSSEEIIPDKEELNIINEKEIIDSYENLINLIPPQNNIIESLNECKSNEERLSKITKYSSIILFNHNKDIYNLNLKKLKKILKKLKK